MKRILALLLVIAARAAFAADGQVLINQSTVIAAGGFPYHIKASGSYKLSGNLVSPVTGAIVIDTDQVTLDLGGFKVSCALISHSPDFCIGSFIPRADVTVTNGSVFVTSTPNFTEASGLFFADGLTITIEKLPVTTSGLGPFNLALLAPAFSIVRNNTFAGDALSEVFCPSVVDGNASAGPFTLIGGPCGSSNNAGF